MIDMRYFTLILLILIFAVPIAHAAETVLEVGIPGVAGAEPGKTVPGMITYIRFLYTFVLGFVGIAGFASLVFWGAVWTGSGIIDKKRQAIDGIKNSLTGIAIALTAFIILNTINSDLTIIKLPGLPDVKITSKELLPDLSGIVLTEDGNLTRKQLQEASRDQISFVGSKTNEECNPLCKYDCGCTSMRFLPKSAFDGLTSLAINAGPIVVTGGTENYKLSNTGDTVHETHGPGKPIVDLRFNERLDYLIQKGVRLQDTSRGEPAYELTIGNLRVNAVKEKDHWHLAFTAI